MRTLFQKLPPVTLMLSYAGLFLTLFSVRLIVMHDYASSTPFFDDWDMGVFIHRYAEQSLSLIDWFTPAYQHQMFFSKIVNILFFELNGRQWDTLNILVFNSVLWSLIGVLLVFFARSHRDKINAPAFIVCIFSLWLLPISVESATWAIVTHYYFMMIFLLLAYWGIGYKPYSSRWIIGIISLTCSTITIGAGVFVPIPLLAIFCYRLLFEANNKRDNLHTFISLLFVGAFAASTTLLWKLAESSNEHYIAKSTSAFFSTLTKTLSWPLVEHYWLGIILVAPTIILVISVIRKAIQFTPLVIFTLALSAYMIMQAFGIAYARNDATGLNPAVRYYEFLLLSVVANLMALLIIQNKGKTLISPIMNKVAIVLWVSVIYISIPGQLRIFDLTANEELNRRHHQTKSAKDYLLTNNLEVLKGHPYFYIAFPRSYKKLANWLNQYSTSKSLPIELQVPEKPSLNNNAAAFTYNATIKPVTGGYQEKYFGEDVIGSYNLELGAQNAKGSYTSQVYENYGSYIMIPTLGFLGLNGLSLEVVEIETGKVHTVKPRYNSSTPEVWQNTYLKMPIGKYQIYAKDDSKKLWFGFAAPRVAGSVSYFIRSYLIDKRMLILSLGLFILLIAFHKPLIRLLQQTESD